MASNIVFLEQWKDELLNDEFAPMNEEEVAYMMYAAAIYCWTGEKTDFKEVFDRGDLNRVMAPYYAQIDNITNYKENLKRTVEGKQSFDNEAIKELAIQGISQKEICRRLGYDEARSRSLSSNRGYKEGRAIFMATANASAKLGSLIVSKNVSQKVSSESELSEKVRTDETDKKSETFDF